MIYSQISSKAVLSFLIGGIFYGGIMHAEPLPELRVDGRHLFEPDGQRITLRGANLGNWFLLESWMLDIDSERVPDHHTFVTTLAERFGEGEADRLMDVHYANWITAADFERLKKFGFNAVRLPFHYALVERDAGASPYEFRWLDHAIALARDAGVYVILDLHGAPGGQSIDQPSGRVGQNDLWTSEEAQQRTVTLWRAVAERYADEPTVAAYDLLNEPYGDLRQDLRGPVIALMDRLIPAVRSVDPDTLIYVPGTLQGISFYGDPAERGWSHVGFTEHYYRGLFGDEETLATHLDMLGPTSEAKQAFFTSVDAPFLVGEFNVVFDHLGGADVMRAYFDRFEALGWAATMWCYKRVLARPNPDGDGWAMVTNAKPMLPIDIFRDSAETIEAKFVSYAGEAVFVTEGLRSALTASESVTRLPFPRSAGKPAFNDPLPEPWTAEDIGDTTPGGQRVTAERWSVVAGGRDINGTADEFRFVSRSLPPGDFVVSTVIESFEAADRYAKAGWMVRASDRPDAAHVLLHTFPRGQLLVAQRAADGVAMSEQTVGFTRFPIGLAIERRENVLLGYATDIEGHWHRVIEREVAWLDGPDVRVGLATLAHDALRTVSATYRRPDLLETSGELEAIKMVTESGATLDLANRSFESDEEWRRWGTAAHPSVTSASAVDGDAVLRFAPSDQGNESGVWQDLAGGIRHGDRVIFEAMVRVPESESSGSTEIELRLESPPLFEGGPWITLARDRYNADDFPKGGRWLPINTRGAVLGDAVRVLIRFDGGMPVDVDRIRLMRLESSLKP